MNMWYATIKDTIAWNGFSFKGVGAHSLSVRLLIPQLFPLFSPGFLYDQKKLSQICPDGIYSFLQGLVYAHFEGTLRV